MSESIRQEHQIMNIEKMREEFEAEWSRKSGWSDMQLKIFRTGDDYSDQSTSSAWWGWQASRAAIEVELPAFDGYRDFVVRELQAAFIGAAERAGLKVKS